MPEASAARPEGGARPRSVALIGPQGSGKSTLFEALLAAAGGAPRRTGDARNRVMGTELRVGHGAYLGDPWAVIDCPGSVEFAYETACALAVCDIAVLVCEPSPDRALAVAPLLKQLEAASTPTIVFVNKIDTLGEGRIRDTLAALQPYSKRPLVLRQVPIREGEQIAGYVDLISERAYRFRKGQPSEVIAVPAAVREREAEARNALLEVLADHDDALLEKVLEDAAVTPAEVFRPLHADMEKGAVVEVMLGAAEHNSGIQRLWKALRHDGPNPLVTAARRGVAPEGEPLVQVFKTQHTGAGGKLSFVRVWRGPVKDGQQMGGARIGGITRFPAGEPTRVAEAGTGEIVALGRLEGAATGATLVAAGPAAERLPFPPPPEPVYALAIATEDRKDDVKLSGALQRIAEEDPSVIVEYDGALGQTVLRGQGDIHLGHALQKLAANYGLRLNASHPRVPYKETIRRAVHQHARHKRQTGGHGQFADVKLEIEPRGRGEGFLFTDRIVGGAIPKKFIPAVGEAAEEACRKGPLGFPVVDVAVTLVDGQFHSVDSSDMAFATATRIGMQEGLAKADPVLLEPIDHVTVTVPNEYTASAQRLLTGRRGQILGYAEKEGWPGWDEVEALVPQAELHDLIIELRSLTMGLGTFRRRFDHLAEARGAVHAGATVR
ncbi:elongation factor G [Caldovatus aquaticus]|uniref:Elongation factor G n=1 Tax=Caldovatus aquaticus TaxID=2865671 RepID=A0ABS7EZW0_9PROT|nr:elongation factor G [Caldovatus aquaticus]MBW8268893.1 elongation factor G [Caldovatus aquaticus]